jgi:hypothetical protein
MGMNFISAPPPGRNGGTKQKQRGGHATFPLLVYTPAFSSRQTDVGKLMTFLGATEHAHGHHTHAHLAHHHGDATLHISFPPSVIFPAAVFRLGWWNHNAVKAQCQPLFFLSAFSTKNLRYRYAIS